MMQRNTIEFSGSNSVIMSTGTELDTETSEENGLPGVLSPANRVRSIGKMRRIWENQPSCLRRWV